MWTGLGVIFIIVALVAPILLAIIRFLVLLFMQSEDKNITEKEAKDAYKEKSKYYSSKFDATMDAEYRKQKLQEEPTSTVIRKQLCTSRYMGDTYYSISNYEYDRGNTKHLYKYLETPCDLDEMKKYGNYGRSEYEHYLTNISTLVHQYINAIEYDDFYDGFTQLLESDHELLMKFIKECHAAEEWKVDNNTIYDCNNYLFDFMKENDIQSKIYELTGQITQFPKDFRHYKNPNPSNIVADYIESEEAIAKERVIETQNNLKANRTYGASSKLAVIGIISLILWFCSSFNMILGITTLIWTIAFFIVLFKGVKKEDMATNSKRKINVYNLKMPINPIYEWALSEGEKYAKKRCDILFYIKPRRELWSGKLIGKE